NRTVPTDPHFETLVSFYGDVKTFPYFSFVDVVTGKLPKENFKGKIVLVGFTATGLGEQRATPLSTTLPAVEYIANVTENILQGNVFVQPPWARNFELAGLVLFALFITLCVPMLYPSLLLVFGYVVMVSRRYFGTERAKDTLETESVETLKMLGLSFQGQGMLDMAWEKFRRVPIDTGMKDTLY